jgi:1-deoxy-D-xylulose-5-phosphate synthase
LGECLDINNAPSVIRFPKGAVAKDLPAFERREGLDILYRGESADVLLVSIGAMAAIAVEAAAQAYREGVGVTVIDPRWVKPLPAQALISMARRYTRVVVLEDGIKHGGIASTLSEIFRENSVSTPIHSIGVPLEFIEHSKRNEIMEDLGITAQNVARQLVGWASIRQEAMQLHADETVDRKPLH